MTRTEEAGKGGSGAGAGRSRVGVTLCIAAALALAGCAQQRFEKMLGDGLARQVLECTHPAGEFRSAGEVRAEASDAFTGVIYWRGTTLGNDYGTKVRVKVEGSSAKVFLLEDSAVVPALTRSCRTSPWRCDPRQESGEMRMSAESPWSRPIRRPLRRCGAACVVRSVEGGRPRRRSARRAVAGRGLERAPAPGGLGGGPADRERR